MAECQDAGAATGVLGCPGFGEAGGSVAFSAGARDVAVSAGIAVFAAAPCAIRTAQQNLGRTEIEHTPGCAVFCVACCAICCCAI